MNSGSHKKAFSSGVHVNQANRIVKIESDSNGLSMEIPAHYKRTSLSADQCHQLIAFLSSQMQHGSISSQDSQPQPSISSFSGITFKSSCLQCPLSLFLQVKPFSLSV